MLSSNAKLIIYTEDGGSVFLQNAGMHQPEYNTHETLCALSCHCISTDLQLSSLAVTVKPYYMQL